MTVLKSDLKNQKWRIQYGHLAYNSSVNSGFFCCNWLENVTRGFCDSWWQFSSQNLKNFKWRSNMAVTYSKFYNFFYFRTTIGQKIRRLLRSLKMVVNLYFEMTNLIWRPCIRFPVKIRRFSSGKTEKYYSSVSGITTNLIRNLNSANENSILRSHTWRFDRIHIHSFEKFIKGFLHLSCHISFFWQFEVKLIFE